MRVRLFLLVAALSGCPAESPPARTTPVAPEAGVTNEPGSAPSPDASTETSSVASSTSTPGSAAGAKDGGPFRCVIDAKTFAPQLASEWRGYTVGTLNLAPRETVLTGLQHLKDRSVTALDLGAGAGNDTRYLLGLGLRVHAVEPDPFAVAVIRACAEQQGTSDALTIHPRSFEAMKLPEREFGFVHASLSLPFAAPETFSKVWSQIVSSMADGAIFSGDFFGPRHGWAKNPELTILSEEEVRALFTNHGLSILSFEERDGMMPVVDGENVRFHKFDVVARRGARPGSEPESGP